MATSVDDVRKLVQDVLSTLPTPYSEDVIEELCTAIEATESFKQRYDTLVNELKSSVVNPSLGKFTAELTGRRGGRRMKSRSGILETYRKLPVSSTLSLWDRIVTGVGSGVGVVIVLSLIAVVTAVGADDRLTWVCNVVIVLLGVALGGLVGFLVSPFDDEEQNFATYGKYLVAGITGYMASKLDQAITLSVIAVTTDQLAAIRMASFWISFSIALMISFSAHRYITDQ